MRHSAKSTGTGTEVVAPAVTLNGTLHPCPGISTLPVVATSLVTKSSRVSPGMPSMKFCMNPTQKSVPLVGTFTCAEPRVKAAVSIKANAMCFRAVGMAVRHSAPALCL